MKGLTQLSLLSRSAGGLPRSRASMERPRHSSAYIASLSYPYCKDLPEHLLGRELAWSDLATPLLSPPASLSYPYCKDLLEDVLGRGLAWRDLATCSSLLRVVELSFPLDCIQRELLVTATSCYACFNQSSLRS